jgi:hypothetical protein
MRVRSVRVLKTFWSVSAAIGKAIYHCIEIDGYTFSENS